MRRRAREGGETSVPHRLFELLADRDARVVQSAVAAIQSLGTAQTEALALDAARSSELRVRRAGLRIAAYFGYAAAIGVLVEAMNDEDERIRDAAIFGLPYIEDPRALGALLRASAHPAARTRAAAMRALGQTTRDPQTITALRLGLHDPDAWVRYFACQALSRLKDEGSADMIAALLRRPGGAGSGRRRRGARAAPGCERARGAPRGRGRGGYGSAARGAPRSRPGEGPGVAPHSPPGPPRSGPRDAPRVGLGPCEVRGASDVVEDLGAVLADGDESVRGAAIALLASRPGPEATRALLAHLGIRAIQARIVSALAQPAEGRVGALADALRSATAETAPLLVTALARAHRVDATLVLEDGFATQGVIVRRAIAEALAAMGTASARSLLAHAASQDPDEEVRQISAAAAER